MPFAVENVAALFDWPDDELTEGEFLAEIVERTGAAGSRHRERLRQRSQSRA